MSETGIQRRDSRLLKRIDGLRSAMNLNLEMAEGAAGPRHMLFKDASMYLRSASESAGEIAKAYADLGDQANAARFSKASADYGKRAGEMAREWLASLEREFTDTYGVAEEYQGDRQYRKARMVYTLAAVKAENLAGIYSKERDVRSRAKAKSFQRWISECRERAAELKDKD